jgi:hypothetical protein
VFTTGPDPMEQTGCLGQIVSKTSAYLYAANGTFDCSNSGQMAYAWMFQRGAPISASGGGMGICFGDGTDLVGYHIAGGNLKSFTHDSGNPYFQCMLIDTMHTRQGTHPHKRVWIGTDTLTWSAITQIGTVCDNDDNKAVGGTQNYFTDIVRIGNSGLFITGGTNSDPGTFGQIANNDASNASGKAFGIVRELAPGLFGVQGPLKFGDDATAENAIFNDSAVISFENRIVADDKYNITIQGNSTQINKFLLSDTTITSAGPAVRCDFAKGEIDDLDLDTVTFSNLKNGIKFSNLADASGHYVDSCTFTQCRIVDPGTVSFTNNTFSNPVSSGTGAILFDADGTDNISGLSFISGGVGHAIYIDTSGYYTLTNFSYTGYGSTGTTDAVVHNDSGGPVTLNISGGTSPTYYNNAAGSSTTLVQTVTITVTVIDEAGDPVENAQVALYVGETQVMNEDTSAMGVAAEDYGGSTPTQATLRIRKGSSTDTPKYLPISSTQTITGDGLTVTITLIEDTNNNS